jgi:hypothetical protein
MDHTGRAPSVTPGESVVLQLRTGRYTDAAGNVGHLPTPPVVLVVSDPADCCRVTDPEDPGTTLCPDCVESWALDWYITPALEQLYPPEGGAGEAG